MIPALPVCAVMLTLPLAQPGETVVRLKVHPARAPHPALRYQLLPELHEMNPGNPVQGYLKSFMEQQNFYYNKDAIDAREKWLTVPLKELPVEELHDYGGNALKQADYAARLDTPDWQILVQIKTEGSKLLLPDLQVLRRMADGLKVRFRAEVASRRFDDALHTARTMFALAKHLGEHPTPIGNLIALVFEDLALDPLEEMLQQPGCPNLYWALTHLPSPLVDLRKAMQGERAWQHLEFREISDRAPMTDAQIRRTVERLQEFLNIAEQGSWWYWQPAAKGTQRDAQARLEAQTRDADRVRAARQRLQEAGIPEARQRQFPAAQVILLDERRAFEERRDAVAKVLTLPVWQARSLVGIDPDAKHRESLFGGVQLGGYKLLYTSGRMEQRVALLRCVEALRLYAAYHDGKLPAKLDDVKVPLPVDPMTGKAFVYQVKDGTATLRGTPPRGLERMGIFNVRYEVTIAK
jgi:hypothetical protein